MTSLSDSAAGAVVSSPDSSEAVVVVVDVDVVVVVSGDFDLGVGLNWGLDFCCRLSPLAKRLDFTLGTGAGLDVSTGSGDVAGAAGVVVSAAGLLSSGAKVVVAMGSGSASVVLVVACLGVGVGLRAGPGLVTSPNLVVFLFHLLARRLDLTRGCRLSLPKLFVVLEVGSNVAASVVDSAAVEDV